MSTTTEHLLIALWGPEPKEAVARLKKQHPHIEVTYFDTKDTNNFADVYKLGEKIPAEVWKKATIVVTLFALPRTVEMVPNLKYLHLFSAGIDHFATHPLFTTPHSIPISTSTGIAAPPIAEYIIMTLLSLTNRLPQQLTWQSQSTWGSKALFLASPGDWVGKTVGILGYGSIGRHTARLLVAMGARIFAYTASPRNTPESRKDKNYCIPGTGDPEGTWPEKWFSGTSKEDLHAFLGCGLHALIMTLPLTKSTHHLLGAEEFALLQSTSPYNPSPFDAENSPPAGAFIVNISRGGILDQNALIDALKRKVIRAAALDVTDPEPLPEDSELWGLENVLVTPHTSGLGAEYGVRGFELMSVNIGLLVRGEKPWNLVGRGSGY